MEESSLIKDYKQNKKQTQEYITPVKLRKFVKEQLGDIKDKIIFDPAIGSGQLLYDLDCKKKIGVEIQTTASEMAKKNGIDEVYNEDYILFDDANLNYDIVLTNYPFSLKPNEEQQKYLINKYKIKKYTGKLDREFILKSFLKAKEKGYYLAFPGILYRREEKEFRELLIENNYLDSIYWLEDNGFEETKISLIFLILDKHKKNNIIKLKKFKKLKEEYAEETTTEEISKNQYTIDTIYGEEEQKEEINIEEENKKLYEIYLNSFSKFLKTQFELKNELDGFNFLSKEKLQNDLSRIIKNI